MATKAADENETYWAEFYAAVDELLAEWQAQYDPDGELSILELIAAANE